MGLICTLTWKQITFTNWYQSLYGGGWYWAVRFLLGGAGEVQSLVLIVRAAAAICTGGLLLWLLQSCQEGGRLGGREIKPFQSISFAYVQYLSVLSRELIGTDMEVCSSWICLSVPSQSIHKVCLFPTWLSLASCWRSFLPLPPPPTSSPAHHSRRER